MRKTRNLVIVSLALSSRVALAGSAEPGPLEETLVIGFTPLGGIAQSLNQLPYSVQTATAREIDKSQSLDISDFMNRYLNGVQIAQSQNNPLQPDVQYRGFTASPLLGNAQGLSVYMNGVRINEPFGDAVNWDIIPQSAIAELNLVGGSNPLFGLNTLGGALSLTTKNGFRHTKDSLRLNTGSYNRNRAVFESGGNNDNYSYFVTGSWLAEDGWRDFSDTEAKQIFGSVGWHEGDTEIELNVSLADTDLNGNGSAPIELLAIDRQAVFTHPDNTRNKLSMASIVGSHRLSTNTQVSAVVYARQNDRDTFNGDGADYDVVQGFDQAGNGLDADGIPIVSNAACDGACAVGQLVEDGSPLLDLSGELINPGLEEDSLAVNNRSDTKQDGAGLSIQLSNTGTILSHENTLILGFSYDQADIDYGFATEVAEFTDKRGTMGSGTIDAATLVNATIETNTTSVYLLENFSVSDAVSLSLSARYNRVHIDIAGTRGDELLVPDGESGNHRFSRVNPGAGLIYTPNDSWSFYASYGESSRVPTAAELTCHDPASPCALPNAFLSDPPLDEVVAVTWELGLRGGHEQINWHVGAYETTNHNDIYFLPTEEGPGLSPGYFDDIGRTRRRGIELSANASHEKWSWFFSYNWIDAIFENDFLMAVENNPYAIENGIVNLTVRSGNTLPGVPEHGVKGGFDWLITPRLNIGIDASYRSSVYFRGDEANLSNKIGGYTVVNAHASYSVNKHIEFFIKIDNLLDHEYESFGLYGQPDEAPGFENFSNPRFLGAGAPRGAWIGIELKL